jgi:hypothetical protein
MLKNVGLMAVGVFVLALLGVSGVSPVEVLNAVGLHDVSNAIETAMNGFEQINEAFAAINANSR